jgi:hypothetical protein
MSRLNIVHINGVALIPGIDYSVSENGMLSFSTAPQAGADIVFTEVVNQNTGETMMTRLTGDGHTYLFRLETNFADRVHISEMFQLALKYKDHPTVRDAINKLQTVLELVKE